MKEQPWEPELRFAQIAVGKQCENTTTLQRKKAGGIFATSQ
ncbi:hypothetical protein JCM19237_3197 [Photobacterium aphoticum]|uniref:Uncharacterized protein n=1 Tax=Photobacterium aphoticum TaxID=754436 RepID=A0A090QYA6_9GAMM|nr:hypothetical protein JCM19237_3197 [Photobacterium aphoticum]